MDILPVTYLVLRQVNDCLVRYLLGVLEFLEYGGAETVLAIRNGNKLLGIEAFRLEDTEDTIDYLCDELFPKWNLKHKDALIFGDYCGMGGPMLRALKRRKWSNVRFVDSRNKATEPKTYANRGSELFFNMRHLLSAQ